MPTEFQLLAQRIEKLSSKAHKVLSKEKSGVIRRIKAAIEAYEISPRELFDSPFENPFGARPKTAVRAASPISLGAPKFSDGKGHSWSGRGPRPQWLRDALAKGRTLNDFLTKKQSAKGAGKRVAGKRRSAQKGLKVAPKFRDSSGNTWTGRGLKPRWLQAAISSGKKLEDFAI